MHFYFHFWGLERSQGVVSPSLCLTFLESKNGKTVTWFNFSKENVFVFFFSTFIFLFALCSQPFLRVVWVPPLSPTMWRLQILKGKPLWCPIPPSEFNGVAGQILKGNLQKLPMFFMFAKFFGKSSKFETMIFFLLTTFAWFFSSQRKWEYQTKN